MVVVVGGALVVDDERVDDTARRFVPDPPLHATVATTKTPIALARSHLTGRRVPSHTPRTLAA